MKIEKLESFVAKLEAVLGKKNNEYLLGLLTKALADEWLASYQYWVCKNLSEGEGKEEADSEFDQHFKEEMAHVDLIMKRIKELGGKPIFNPKSWEEIGNPWTEVNTSDIKTQLDITIKAEADAVEYYNTIADYVKNSDKVTFELIQGIIKDEEEHYIDLKKILDKINKT